MATRSGDIYFLCVFVFMCVCMCLCDQGVYVAEYG